MIRWQWEFPKIGKSQIWQSEIGRRAPVLDVTVLYVILDYRMIIISFNYQFTNVTKGSLLRHTAKRTTKDKSSKEKLNQKKARSRKKKPPISGSHGRQCN